MEPLTAEHVQELKTMLYINNDRTGMYMRYYELTGGNKEVLLQAKISTFSFEGGMANAANRFLDWKDEVTGRNLYDVVTKPDFSNQVASGLMTEIERNVEQGGNGHLSEAHIFDLARESWEVKGSGGDFPGHIVEVYNALKEGELEKLRLHFSRPAP